MLWRKSSQRMSVSGKVICSSYFAINAINFNQFLDSPLATKQYVRNLTARIDSASTSSSSTTSGVSVLNTMQPNHPEGVTWINRSLSLCLLAQTAKYIHRWLKLEKERTFDYHLDQTRQGRMGSCVPRRGSKMATPFRCFKFSWIFLKDSRI